MIKVKGLIAAVLAAGTVMAAAPASADGGTSASNLDSIPWITVSSWAYPDVSNFRKVVEMPESFADVTDYTQPVNRVQTANLLYETLVASGEIYDYVEYGDYKNRFEDTDDPAAGVLRDYDIMRGEPTGEDEYGYTLYNFYPDRPLTREELAAVLRRTTRFFRLDAPDEQQSVGDIADYGDISDYAREDVLDVMGCGLMNGVGGGKFAPKDNLTIEQTVVTLYRLFRQMPHTPAADGAALPDGQELKQFRNGVTEERIGNTLYLKRGSDTLMEFETDIYENVFCADNNGVTYAAAENTYNRADVYNAYTRELLFRIPYPVYEAQSDYIITKSSDTGKCTFGLYGYDGNEVLEPKYSLSEIDILKANNFVPPEEEYRAPDGWVYYFDYSDGHIYRIDTNGENKQKLSDNDCFDIEYVNGWLYYTVRGADENKLYTMRADGKYEQRLTDECAGVIKCGKRVYDEDRPSGDMGDVIINGRNLGDIITPYFDGGWVYYFEAVNEYKTLGNLWRVRMNEDGTTVKEKVSDEIFGCDNLHSSTASFTSQQNDGKLYLLNSDRDKLYIFGGGDERVIEANINEFGFYGDKLVMSVITGETDENGKSVTDVYLAEQDGSDMRMWPDGNNVLNIGTVDWLDTYVDPETGATKYNTVYYSDSDERFTVYAVNILVPHGRNGMMGGIYGLHVMAADGTDSEVCAGSWQGGIERIGDILYYTKSEMKDGRMSGALLAYDMNTGEQTRMADDVNRLTHAGTSETNGDFLLYEDNIGNIWRYNITDGKSAEIFPNANLKKYGVLADWSSSDNSFFKIDTDGGFTTIVDNGAAIYVPDGLPVDVTP